MFGWFKRKKKKKQLLVDIKRSDGNQWYFNIKAMNGEVIATSEMYTRKSKARQTVDIFVKGFVIKRINEDD